MTALPRLASTGGDRFPGFDVLSQHEHWDPATQATIERRLGGLPQIRFFDAVEEACATALFDQLLDQRTDPKVPVTRMVDSRLAEKQTDGWHYDSMPPDPEAWRLSLAALDTDARNAYGTVFADCAWEAQHELLVDIQGRGSGAWHGMSASAVWGLWTRYACTAFYSHPWAWNEIGFAGPAYPRGYKNLGVDRLEPFEVPDATPADNPDAGATGSSRG